MPSRFEIWLKPVLSVDRSFFHSLAGQSHLICYCLSLVVHLIDPQVQILCFHYPSGQSDLNCYPLRIVDPHDQTSHAEFLPVYDYSFHFNEFRKIILSYVSLCFARWVELKLFTEEATENAYFG